MPADTRTPGSDGDDWLSGGGEFDWGDEPSGPGRPTSTRTSSSRPPAGDDPDWPPSRPPHRPDDQTIMRRRILWLSVALASIVVIVIAVAALGGGSDDPTTAVTTDTTPAVTPPPPPPPPTKTTTTPNTTTTPATGTITLAEGETLETGATGAEVTALQEALKELGFYTGTVDGDFGEGTAAAVGAFQRANGLGDDGVVGPATAEAITDALAADTSGTAGA